MRSHSLVSLFLPLLASARLAQEPLKLAVPTSQRGAVGNANSQTSILKDVIASMN